MNNCQQILLNDITTNIKNSLKYIDDGATKKFSDQFHFLYNELIDSSFINDNVLNKLLTQPMTSSSRILDEGNFQ